MCDDNLSEVVTDTDHKIGIQVSRLYQLKASRSSVVKRYIRFKKPRNINNDDFEQIVAICGDTKTRFVLEPEPKYELTNGGLFQVKRYPAGSRIDCNFMSSNKKQSIKCGLNLDQVGVFYETDGRSETSSSTNIKTLTHDIITIRIKGNRNFMGKSYLTPNVEYLEIDRKLEKMICDSVIRKDMELFQDNKLDQNEDLEQNDSIFNKIFEKIRNIELF